MTPSAECHLHCPSVMQHQKLLPWQGEVSRRDGGVICNIPATHPVLRTPLHGGDSLSGICNAAPNFIEFAIQYSMHNYIPDSNSK